MFVRLAQDSATTTMYCLVDGSDKSEPESIRWSASRFLGLYRDLDIMNMRVCFVSPAVLALSHARYISLNPDSND
jgi:hypothetical protein